MGISSALLICNVNLIPVNAPTNSNRGILMAFSGANLDFVATNCMSAYSFIFILLSCILYGSALFLRRITKGVHNIRRQESKRIINSSFLQHVSFFFHGIPLLVGWKQYENLSSWTIHTTPQSLCDRNISSPDQILLLDRLLLCPRSLQVSEISNFDCENFISKFGWLFPHLLCHFNRFHRGPHSNSSLLTSTARGYPVLWLSACFCHTYWAQKGQ